MCQLRKIIIFSVYVICLRKIHVRPSIDAASRHNYFLSVALPLVIDFVALNTGSPRRVCNFIFTAGLAS